MARIASATTPIPVPIPTLNEVFWVIGVATFVAVEFAALPLCVVDAVPELEVEYGIVDNVIVTSLLVADVLEDTFAVVASPVELDGTKKSVPVLTIPVTPIIVFASPIGTEKVPLPFSQLQVPAAAAGSQHHFPLPQFCKDPLFADTGLSRQKSPQAVLFHFGFVQVPRIAVPRGNAFLTAPRSVTIQRLFEKHVHPEGQHKVVNA